MKIYSSFAISKIIVIVTLLATTTLVHANTSKNLRGGRLLLGVAGPNACSGPNQQCKGNEGAIGDEACQGEWDDEKSTVYGVCMRNKGTIGKWACSGYGKNCHMNTGVIEAGACKGKDACMYNHNQNLDSSIGHSSCLGTDTCKHNEGTIGMGACMRDNACPYNQGIIETGCCNANNYIEKCDYNNGIIAKIPGSDQCEYNDRPKAKPGEKCNSSADCLGGYDCAIGAENPDEIIGSYANWVCCSSKGSMQYIIHHGFFPHCIK